MTIYPTVLYIKQHSITGLKYFGKTTRDPYKYNGSGTHWKSHIKKHGKEHIVTLWVSEPYLDSILISDYSLEFSKDNNIVESKEWANLIDEDGLGSIGRVKGYIPSNETRAKQSIAQTGKTQSNEAIAKSAASRTGLTRSDETRAKQSIAHTGKAISNEHRANMGIAQTKLHDILTPDGFVLEQISTKEFCSRFNLNYGSVGNSFRGNRAYKGFVRIY